MPTLGSIEAWPLVGRNAELDELERALAADDRAGAIVFGPPGVGKTRVAAESIARATSGGAVTRWLVATPPTAEIPFGTLASILPGHAAGYRPNGDRASVYLTTTEALASLAEAGPVILGIDDAQHLDPASAALVHQLATVRTVKVVLTARARSALPAPIVALWKEDLVAHVELHPFELRQVEELLSAVLGGQVDRALAYDLWSRTEGNALYLRELVAAGRRDGRIGYHDGFWRLLRPLSADDRLVELVELSIGSAGPEASDLLDLLALGEPLPIEVLERVATPEAIAAAERAELLVVRSDGLRRSVRLAHPLYAEALTARMGEFRARRLAGTLVDAYRETGLRRREDMIRYATWSLDSGRPCEPRALLAAATSALEGSDAARAERLARAAIASGGGTTAQMLLADSLIKQGRLRESADVLDEAEGTNDWERTLLGTVRASISHWAFNEPEEAQQLLARVRAQVQDPECERFITSRQGRMQSETGHVAAGVEVARAVLRDTEDPVVAWEAKETLGPALAMMGRFEEAIALATECMDPRSRPQSKLAVNIEWPTSTTVLATFFSGALDTAELLSDAVYRTGLGLGQTQLQVIGASSLGAIALARGDVAAAAARYGEAAAWHLPSDFEGLRPATLGGLGHAFALAGQVDRAREAIARGDAEAHPVVTWFRPTLELGRAWTAAAGGEVTRAIEILTSTAAAAGRRGQHAYELWLLLDAARLGGAAQVAARLRELQRSVHGAHAEASVEYAEAAAAGDGAALDRVANRFAELGMWLVAAQASLAAAAAHRAGGRLASAAASAAACQAHGERCPGLAPWVLADVPADDLTPREREVARVVAAGASNRAAAERLGISVRTVEAHLARVYAKLGVHDRADLAVLLT